MKIDYTMETIELTKAEASKAKKYGSDVYNEITAIRKDFPSFTVVTKETKRHSSAFQGMGYEFMENYVKNHDENGNKMEEFKKLRSDNSAYGTMKKWFFKNYPQFKDFTTRAEWVLAA